ncbi:hypothetical protein B0F90DRAFT_692775 [Multifurca ochricompacta]|uniref:Uncharacterized protein n=1 Tax=Multifurca ochricompacta TaxID=376703 RepID=A0AAD4LTV0_9AGAM|nr:hypothetical protein B0F90DRAFT_692775 [Multifurca ochricompacta]
MPPHLVLALPAHHSPLDSCRPFNLQLKNYLPRSPTTSPFAFQVLDFCHSHP